MGFLGRAIRNGIRNGVSEAIGNAVREAIEPEATKLANKAAEKIDNTKTEYNNQRTSEFDTAMSNLQRSVEGYATKAAQNIKICPKCNKPASADNKFCPNCGAELPEETLAAGAVCSKCGKQNTVGTKFCSDCGTKLPMAVQEDEAAAKCDLDVMTEWDEKLPEYPKWNCGGTDYGIELIDGGYIMFAARFKGDPNAAYSAVRQYQAVLLQSGFRQAGQYPSIEHLYKKENGVCCHVDTEHCFDGDGDCPTVYFSKEEPLGGYDYVKPEPRQKTSLRDLFKF